FRPKRWVWGLPPLALLIALTISFAEAPVTADIAKRVSGQLAGQGFDWAKVETVGRDVRLTGQAPSPEA
ncbi:hypothetical protein, partial [Streptococcus pneumoniae]|uniref:hypothetical protein n=1 Tax=Streptococcus pneumoniae TaxID=1313 RepID=UPI001953C64F